LGSIKRGDEKTEVGRGRRVADEKPLRSSYGDYSKQPDMMIMRDIAVFIRFVFRVPCSMADNFCLNFDGEEEITSAWCLGDWSI